MEIKARENRKRLKGVGLVSSAVFNYEDMLDRMIDLQPITLPELQRLRLGQPVLGLPCYYCMNVDHIELWPAPDQDGDLIVYYYPPMRRA